MAFATNPQTGERLQFDEGSQQWIPAAPQVEQPIQPAMPPEEAT